MKQDIRLVEEKRSHTSLARKGLGVAAAVALVGGFAGCDQYVPDEQAPQQPEQQEQQQLPEQPEQ
ncbi:MAG: hypothetical protein R6U56_07435 [Opitutales bacterium]